MRSNFTSILQESLLRLDKLTSSYMNYNESYPLRRNTMMKRSFAFCIEYSKRLCLKICSFLHKIILRIFKKDKKKTRTNASNSSCLAFSKINGKHRSKYRERK